MAANAKGPKGSESPPGGGQELHLATGPSLSSRTELAPERATDEDTVAFFLSILETENPAAFNLVRHTEDIDVALGASVTFAAQILYQCYSTPGLLRPDVDSSLFDPTAISGLAEYGAVHGQELGLFSAQDLAGCTAYEGASLERRIERLVELYTAAIQSSLQPSTPAQAIQPDQTTAVARLDLAVIAEAHEELKQLLLNDVTGPILHKSATYKAMEKSAAATNDASREVVALIAEAGKNLALQSDWKLRSELEPTARKCLWIALDCAVETGIITHEDARKLVRGNNLWQQLQEVANHALGRAEIPPTYKFADYASAAETKAPVKLVA